MVPKIIYETPNILAIDKPSGLMIHAAKISSKRKREVAPEPTLVDWLLKKYPKIKNVGDDPAIRPGIVHRLDKDTSGVMLVAKNQEYFEYLKSLFQKHAVKKTYYAVVVGVPKKSEGIIDAPIGIRTGTLKRSVRSTKMQKEAVTEYNVVRTFAGQDAQKYSLLEVHPKTGRTHQIRVHLASIGHPIVGDKIYGSKKQLAKDAASFPRLMLHAAAIEFPEKDGSMVRLSTVWPIASFKDAIMISIR